jgi:hypothetical protein
VIWKKIMNQPPIQLKAKSNRTREMQNAVLVLTLLMSLAFIWQNFPVSNRID